MCSYRDRPEAFAALDATIVGISAQDLDSHQGLIDKNNLTVPLLADVDKQVAKAYSAVGPLGTKRAVIVIDEVGSFVIATTTCSGWTISRWMT
jgi:peroxiredoxin Q/BCP